MKLLWITDPHLNFLPTAEASRMLGEYLCQEHSFDAVIKVTKRRSASPAL